MADIKISSNGDLQTIKLTNKNTIVTDLVEERDVLNLLLKRALLSPKGHITITEISNNELSLKDKEYGNRIYEELSEGLSINFLSRVRSHVTEAIENANLTNMVTSIEVNVLDKSSIQILVLYSNGTNNIIRLNL